MNIKLIGDPNAAASLLRLVTLADGIGEVIRATPPVRGIGQQQINRATGDPAGDSLVRMAATDGGRTTAQGTSIEELAALVPEVMRVAEERGPEQGQGQEPGEILALVGQKVSGDERTLVKKAQQALAQLPVLNDLPFELYLRMAVR